ncbi:MAG: transposase, partial [Acidobacteria bacterium]|nr:transposase [Acidobacteriota bacterium]
MDETINLKSLAKHFSDADKARDLVEKLRWPNGAVCPHCESSRVFRLVPKEGS